MPPTLKGRVRTTMKGDADFKRLLRDMGKLGSQYVAVGILEPDRTYPDSDATLGQVALWQEYGTHDAKGFPVIPSRSFLRDPVDSAIGPIEALKAKLLRKVQDKAITAEKGLATIGADIVRRIQTAIKKRIDPPLRPYTLKMRKKKGITGTIPLIATSFLFDNIHFAVRRFGFRDLGGGK